MDELGAQHTSQRPRARRQETARVPPHAGPPPGVPLDLALARFGPPKLVAELAKCEVEARLKNARVYSSGLWGPVWEYREQIWRDLCGKVEQDHCCISHLSSEPTGARTIFPSDRCWYLKLPRFTPSDECSDLMRGLGLHEPGPDTLYYLGQKLRGVLIHQAPAQEVATHIWLIGQKAPPTARTTYAWAKAQGYSQPAAWEIVTAVYGPRTPGRRRKSP